MQKICNLAIIGAGPAGIATAVESYLLGMRDIVILEKGPNHNETIRKFYKDNKRVDKDWKGQKVELDGHIYFIDGTKESTLDFFDEVLRNHSVTLKTDVEVHKIEKDDTGIFSIYLPGDVIRARYVVVTIGRMGKPNKPDYAIAPSLKKRVNFTLESVQEQENILVVGGGDSAVEYALELAKAHAVTISYRRETFRRANPTNQEQIKQALKNGALTALFGSDIVGLEEEGDKIKVLFDAHEALLVDRVIYAIGGTTPSAFLSASGIDIEEGRPVHDEQYETNIKGLFVAGDITQERGGSIALGLNHGYQIAQYILKNDTSLRRDDAVLKHLK